MSNRVDLLAQWGDGDRGPDRRPVRLLRLDSNQVGVIPFVTDVTPVKVHYCDQVELKMYLQCNGPDCILCRAGRKAEERFLLPVYVPTEAAVCALPISPASKPGALRPQIMPILRSGKRVAVFIRKADVLTFEVSTVELTEGADDGAKAIAEFKRSWDAKEIDLALAYPKMHNCDLAQIPSIAAMLRLKGINPDDIG
jgi:hypothetical protein